jgi:hypothetical protein
VSDQDDKELFEYVNEKINDHIADAARYATWNKGEPITVTYTPRWYVRLWRWVRGHRDPVYTVHKIDVETSTVYLNMDD